jgi:preprotein translocase subunit SecB
MAEYSKNDQGAGTAGRQFDLRLLYLKDLSFEAPNSPGILTEAGLEPEFSMNLRTSHRDLGNGVVEVVLHVTVHAVSGQRTVFLVELEQAGTFMISGFSADEARTIIGITCPNTLFPYAREVVSSILTRGSFAQLLLKPIDFAQLFAQAQESREAGASPAGEA